MDVVSDTFDVTYRGIAYTFRVPTPFDLVRVGKRAQALRSEASGDGYGDEFGLDPFARKVVNGMAVFDVLLEQCSHAWPMTEKDGKVVCDSKLFKPNKSITVAAVYDLYNEQVTRFLEDGDGRDEPAAAQGVAGSENSAS